MKKTTLLFLFGAIVTTGILAFQASLKSAPVVKKRSLLTATADQLDQGTQRWIKGMVHVEKDKKDKMDFKAVYNERLTCDVAQALGSPTLGQGNPKQLIIYKANNDVGIPIDHRGPINYVNTIPYKYVGVVLDLKTSKVVEYDASGNGSLFKSILKDSSLPDMNPKDLPEMSQNDTPSTRHQRTGAKDITPACWL